MDAFPSLHEIDGEVWQYYRTGLIAGVLILSALVLFPGTNNDTEDASSIDNDATINNNTTNSSSSATSKDQSTAAGESNNNDGRQTARHYTADNNVQEGWSPYKKLNTAVWMILISVTIIVLHSSYNLTWLADWFKGSLEYQTLQGRRA